ncbi:MAG: insulinase family protein [Saprospiraceae bacterium]|nr:insulinase family protein [Saprospiraceae bacterium]
MKKQVILFSILCWITTVGLQAQQSEAYEPMPPYQRFDLENGLKVIVIENPALQEVYLQLFVDLPLMGERQLTGMAELTGRLLMAGAKNRNAAQIAETLDTTDATLSSGRDGLFGSCPPDNIGTMLHMMADIVINPSFPVPAFDSIRQTMISDVLSSRSDPTAIAHKVAAVLRNGSEHPYGELITPQTLNNLTAARCSTFYYNTFKPEMSYLVVAGDVNTDQIRVLAGQYFEPWTRGSGLLEYFPTPEPPAQTKISVIHKIGMAQAVLHLSSPILLNPGSANLPRIQMLNQILGGETTGRLYQKLHDEKNFAFRVLSEVEADPQIGNWQLQATVRSNKVDSFCMVALEEIKRLRTEKIPQAELISARRQLLAAFEQDLDRPQSMIRYYLDLARYKLPTDYDVIYRKQLNEVTADELQEIADSWLKFNRLHILAVGNKNELAPELKPLAIDSTIYFFDSFGKPEEELAIALPQDIDPAGVIDHYLIAIGGKEKLEAVRDLRVVMTTHIQGMSMQIDMTQKAPAKMNMRVQIGGNVVNQTIFDGEKAQIKVMGKPQPVDSATLAGIKEQSLLFPELHYLQMGYSLQLIGVEMLDEKKAYVLDITRPGGKKFTSYFDADTGLKLRTIALQPGPAGEIAVVDDILNYKEMEGIKFPALKKSSGMMPLPLEMELLSLEINKGVDDSFFKVE